MLPEAKKHIVNTVVLGFRGANNMGIYGVFCSESLQKRANTTYLTIFGQYETEKKAAGAKTTTTTTTRRRTTTTTATTATTTTTNNNQQQPTTTNNNQQQPTTTNNNQQQPTTTNNNNNSSTNSNSSSNSNSNSWPRAEAKVDNRHDGFSKLHIVMMYRCQDLPHSETFIFFHFPCVNW